MRMILLVIAFIFSLAAPGQVSKYKRAGRFDDLQTVYVYQKSNWDGTHASQIFLYVADSNRLESFKWTQGDKTATLVTATIDWENYSVSRFTNHRLEQGQAPRLVATLQFDGKKQINIEVGTMRDSLLLQGLPWQSYDFDFAGLGFTWRALVNKKDSFDFFIADAVRVNNNMQFVNKGRVTVNYKDHVLLDGKPCLLYEADGAGLEHKGGQIWINAATLMIEQYKISLPDEPGFENGMLKLIRTEKMMPAAWEVFKNRSVGN